MLRSPAFGGGAWAKAGGNRRNNEYKHQSATKSCAGLIARCIGIAWAQAPSRWACSISIGPGEETKWTSNPLPAIYFAWPARKPSVIGTVVMWTNLKTGEVL